MYTWWYLVRRQQTPNYLPNVLKNKILMKSTTSCKTFRSSPQSLVSCIGIFFCAQCHMDAQRMEGIDIMLSCYPFDVESFGVLTKMKYNPGYLKWTALLTDIADNTSNTYYIDFSDYQTGDTITCSVLYIIEGRDCYGLKKKCPESWPDDETRKRCSSHTYWLVAQEVVYKNFYCAICDNIPSEDISCGFDFSTWCYDFPASLNDIFKITGDCKHWNFLSHECEPVTYNYDRNLTTSLSNGSIYTNSTGKLFKKGGFVTVEEHEIQARQEQTEETPSVLQVVSTVAICISLVCMFLHLFLFLSQQERPSVPSLSHVCMVCSLFLAELVFLLAFGGVDDSYLCMACALLIDFFFTASFLWMSVISFDMCRAFRSRTFRRRGPKTFAIYLGIVTVPSLLKTLTVALVESLSEEAFFLRPNFGMNRCWYNTTWSLSLFFLGPVFTVVATNVIGYIFFVYDFFRQQKVAKFATATSNRNRKLKEGKKPKEAKAKDARMAPPSEPKEEEEVDSPPKTSEHEEHRLLSTYRTQLGIYTKVALLMGISWVLPLIGVFIKSTVFEYISVIMNGLQGAFIFLAFDCNMDKWRNACKRYQCCYKENQTTETISTVDE